MAFVAAPDIGMRAREPDLFDTLALLPQRWWEVGAFLVNGQGLATVLDARTELAVAESQEAKFVPVDQAQAAE